ncbi:MAG TPA: helix-turn-helix domain-containing protein [Gaiellaceae bacterium]|jgi:cytoskeletal protein RodZ|nr:helix-turn-helix domain-containing protein [Gaiellaceae bacterium]
MFEIGSSLRESRTRQGLELEEIAAATMIRARYLDALEQEHFELLPAGSYRASFLREYAEFLGLDGDLYVAEYELQVAPPEPEPPPPRSRFADLIDGLPVRRAAVVAACVVVGVAIWQFGSAGTKVAAPPTQTQAPTRTQQTTHATQHAVTRRPSTLTLSAARGNCWLSVRIGSAGGQVVYEQTLQQGLTVRFGLRKPLWVRLGAPWNLDAAIGRSTVTDALPSRTGDILVTATGLRPIA